MLLLFLFIKVLNDHLFKKKLFIRFMVALRERLSVCECSSLNFLLVLRLDVAIDCIFS